MSEKNYRTESDSIGKRDIPAEAYWGINSLRAKENFEISGKSLPFDFFAGGAASVTFYVLS